MHWASERLATLLTDVCFSSVIWTPDIKGTGRLYMNRLAVGETPIGVDDFIDMLKTLEGETRRTQAEVTIDLDLLQYDHLRYHERDWERPYIQQLLPDVL